MIAFLLNLFASWIRTRPAPVARAMQLPADWRHQARDLARRRRECF